MSTRKNNVLKLTKQDLLDWARQHGCDYLPLPEERADVILIENPKNNNTATLALPINEKPLPDYVVYAICSKLIIPIPTCSCHMKNIHEEITKRHL